MIRHNHAVARSLGAPALIVVLSCRTASPPVPGAVPPAAPTPAPAVTAPPPPAEAPHNTLRWKTNDLSNYGYDIYRAESETGPFVKINAKPVPGALQPGVVVQTFEYEDDAIDPRKDYWYYVESITLLGERVKLTPTLKSPAKIKPSSP